VDEIRDQPTRQSVWEQPPPGPVRGLMARPIGWVRGPIGPYVPAVALALLSLPVVLVDVDTWAKVVTDYSAVPLPPTDPAALVAALFALPVAAVVSSVIGIRIVRSHAVAGWFVTVAVAWLTAILVLPVGPTIAGLPYYTARECVTACRAWIATPEFDTFGLALGWWLSPLLAPWTLVALATGAAVWVWIVRLSMRPVDAAP
jgi:hypothetical protein